MSRPPFPSDVNAPPDSVPPASVVVDARGHRCPTPTLRLRRALEAAPLHASIVLLADDPLARIDVPHFLASHGYAAAVIAEENGALRITVRNRCDGGSFSKVSIAIP